MCTCTRVYVIVCLFVLHVEQNKEFVGFEALIMLSLYFECMYSVLYMYHF